MHEAQGHIEMIPRDSAFGTPRRTTRPIASSITALEGHDCPQPCQVGQCAYEFLGHGVRTASELRKLQFVRSASVRLGDQFDALVTALLCKYTSQVKLPPVAVGPLLKQTIFENEFVVQTKGFGVRMARTSAAIASDALLLGTVLPNLIRIAVKYAQSGRRILLDRCQIDAEGETRPLQAPQRLRCEAIPPTRIKV
jgi:light-regulated signal transduction histidine kinase (bacteriophytochrome)